MTQSQSWTHPHSWTLRACIVIAALAAPSACGAATYKVVHNFDIKRGEYPIGSLVVDRSTGDLYGTAMEGGKKGVGVLFRVSAAGYDVLHHFRGGADGAHPMGSLLLDGAGHLYGTTYDGGSANAGTVFRMDTSGGYHVLASLDGAGQGRELVAGLALGGDGFLYGAAAGGGNAGEGTLLRIDPGSGAIEVIHSFDNAFEDEGAWPQSTPVWDNGTLVGTTLGGSIYTVGLDGSSFQAVDFGYTNNAVFYAGATLDPTGTWWGVIMGQSGDTGDIWRIAPDGSYSIVHNFSYDPGPEGINPAGTLLLAGDGFMYGTNRREGSPCSCGTVYRFLPSSGTGQQVEVLHAFSNTDGREPWAGLVADGKGRFYGVTEYGGKHGAGVIFAIVP